VQLFPNCTLTELVIAFIQSDACTLFKWTNHNNSVVATSARLATPTVAVKRVEMDKSFFSDSILELINDKEDEEEFENIDYLFGQILDEVSQP